MSTIGGRALLASVIVFAMAPALALATPKPVAARPRSATLGATPTAAPDRIAAAAGSPLGSTYEVEARVGEHADGSYTLYRLGGGTGNNSVVFDGSPETLDPYCCNLSTTPTATESQVVNGDGTTTITITLTVPNGKDLFPGNLVTNDAAHIPLVDAGVVVGAFSGDPLDWSPAHKVTAASIELFIGAFSLGADNLDPTAFFDAPAAWDGRVSIVYDGYAGFEITKAVLRITTQDLAGGSAGTVQLSAASASVGEAAGSATVTATRTNGATGAVTVHYATSNGTATAGGDYTATSGNLSWAAGETANKSFSVPINNDFSDEANETVQVALSAPTGGATLGSPSGATLTIVDDDGPATGACTPSATRLCLNRGRFAVDVAWETPQGQSGDGRGVQLTADTGYFWFFQESNVEMVVKLLDGCGLNQRFWVFAGGLTNVRVTMTVTDTATGQVKTYTNPQSTRFEAIQDTSAFATCGTTVSSATGDDLWTPALPASANDDQTLMLGGGRFGIRTTWRRADGQTGNGHAVALSSDTGFFWFFQSSNVEMVVKLLNACGLNQRYWVFAGGLTNVEVTMTVIDTLTPAVRTYTNPQGAIFEAIQDTGAFPTCSGASEPIFVDDGGDLAPPTIVTDPLSPGAGAPATVTAAATGASSIALTASGAGCGAIANQTVSGPTLAQTNDVGLFGACDLTARVTTSGVTKTHRSSFTVVPDDLVLPAIDVPSGDFVAGGLLPPRGGAAAPNIASIAAPGALINGATARLRLTLSNPAAAAHVRTVLVEVPDAAGFDGHYEAAPVLDGTDVVVEVQLDADFAPTAARQLSAAKADRFASQWPALAQAFDIRVQLVDDAGNVGSPLGKSFTTQEVAAGSVTVGLSWDTPTDVDLHVVNPLGHEIYYGNRSADGGSLDLDSNAGCGIDGTNNEHVSWPDAAPNGEYIVRVDFWSDCETANAPGHPANWTVTTTVCGETQTYSGHFAAGSDDRGGAGSGVEVARFTADCSCSALTALDFATPQAAVCTPKRVRGTAKYEKRPLGIRDYGTTVTAPIRLARVYVRRSSDNAILNGQDARTGKDGSFDVLFSNDGTPGYYVEVLTFANGERLLSQSVQDHQGLVYSVKSAAFNEATTPDQAGVQILAKLDGAAPAFNIFDAGVRGTAFYRRLEGELPPGSLSWIWDRGQLAAECGGAGACYRQSDNQIFVADAANGPNAFFDSTLLHEFAHKWSAERAASLGGGNHSFSTRSGYDLAWSEGLANFWAQRVLGTPNFSPFYRGTAGGGRILRLVSLEAPEDVFGQIPVGTSSGSPDGDVNEFVVSRVLWDLVDPAVDPSIEAPERVAGAAGFFDTVDNAAAVFATARSFHPACVASVWDCLIGLHDFLGRWCTLGHDSIGNATTGAQGIVSGINQFPYTFGTCP
jgi:hypothetical protein